MGILRGKDSLTMHYLFVIPETGSFVSGGNLYNQKFIGALRHVTKVDQIRWEIFEEKEQDKATLIIDSIYIDKVNNSLSAFASRKILLIHYLDIFYDEKDNQSLIKKRMEQLQLFDYFIVTGQFSYDWLIQREFKAEQIFIISPSIDISGTKSNLKHGDVKRIVMVGNLLPVKGYFHFLKLLNEIKIPNIQITILGDETIEKEYAKKIRELINESEYLSNNCRIAGTVNHQMMEGYYEENDVLISPSYFETFGMAIHEALQYGLHVLALKGGNIGYIKHPLLRSFDSHEDIIEYLSEWVKGNESLQKSKSPYLSTKTWKELALKFHTAYINNTNSIVQEKGI
jgi:glycosyltransferase involved in cell wall biosynthesis